MIDVACIKESRFDLYCNTCKHKLVSPEEKPCCECLGVGGMEFTHRPLKWEVQKNITAKDMSFMIEIEPMIKEGLTAEKIAEKTLTKLNYVTLIMAKYETIQRHRVYLNKKMTARG